MATYYEKLKDPRWQKRRLEIFNKAGFECESCGSTEKTLHVHHRKYIKGRDPWNYTDDELQCLCEDCHEAVSILNKEIAGLLGELDEPDKEVVSGYLRIMVLFQKWDGPIEVKCPPVELRNLEHLTGIADFCGLTENELTALANRHGRVKFADLKRAFLDKRKRR